MKNLCLLVGFCLLFGLPHGQHQEEEKNDTQSEAPQSRRSRLDPRFSGRGDYFLTPPPYNGQGFSPFAFTATNPVNGENHWFMQEVLVFKRVVTYGEAYDPFTGVFTAQLSGLYYFSFHVFFRGWKGPAVALYLNGEETVSCPGVQSRFFSQCGSNSAVLWLNPGDSVYVGLNFRTSDLPSEHSSFSGYLLYPF